MTPPKTITIKSDNNLLKFQDTIKPNGKGEVQYIYKYTRSLEKLNQLLGLNEKELTNLVNNNL